VHALLDEFPQGGTPGLPTVLGVVTPGRCIEWSRNRCGLTTRTGVHCHYSSRSQVFMSMKKASPLGRHNPNLDHRNRITDCRHPTLSFSTESVGPSGPGLH
jgi:hypothetical protein